MVTDGLETLIVIRLIATLARVVLPGDQAIKQSGDQAIRRSGDQAIICTRRALFLISPTDDYKLQREVWGSKA